MCISDVLIITSALTLLTWCDNQALRITDSYSEDYEGYLVYRRCYILKTKRLAFLLIIALAATLTIQVVDAAEVSGSLNADQSQIVVHQSVTLTCTYITSLGVIGSGTLEISGPKSSPSGPWTVNTVIASWEDSLISGVPVEFTQQLDTSGYYRFRWLCSGGGVDGAFTYVTIQVLDAPTVLPEAPPLAAFALGFAALGLFVVVTKKRPKQP